MVIIHITNVVLNYILKAKGERERKRKIYSDEMLSKIS